MGGNGDQQHSARHGGGFGYMEQACVEGQRLAQAASAHHGGTADVFYQR